MVFAAGYLQVVPKVRSSTLKVCNAVGLNFINQSLKQKLSFNLIKYSYLLCHPLIRMFDLCTFAPEVRVRDYIFRPHIFLYPVARIAVNPPLLFCE